MSGVKEALALRESATWSIAARAVSERIRALPEFAEARNRVVRESVALCLGRDVASMRMLGGFTAVIEHQIGALPPEFSAPRGSKLLPASVASELLALREELRFEVQSACSGAAT